MSFTDDDLKRLKEKPPYYWPKEKGKALLARLEASERFREYVLEYFPGVIANGFVESADEAWLKSKGEV